MTHKLLFDIVTLGSFALPASIALILVSLPRPKSPIARSVVAVLSAWVASVAYTIYAYNPAGIAAGQELGWDSPEMQFDNNTVASQLVGGWMYPSIVVALFFAVRYGLRRRRATAQRMPSNNAVRSDESK